MGLGRYGSTIWFRVWHVFFTLQSMPHAVVCSHVVQEVLWAPMKTGLFFPPTCVLEAYVYRNACYLHCSVLPLISPLFAPTLWKGDHFIWDKLHWSLPMRQGIFLGHFGAHFIWEALWVQADARLGQDCSSDTYYYGTPITTSLLCASDFHRLWIVKYVNSGPTL